MIEYISSSSKLSAEVKTLLSKGEVKKYLQSSFRSGPVGVLPYLNTGDHIYQKFMIDLFKVASDFHSTMAPEYTHTLEVGRLQTLAGYAGRPMGYVPRSNRHMVKCNSFKDSRSAWLFRVLFVAMFSKGSPSTITFADKSSSGVPLFQHERALKARTFFDVIPNVSNVLSTIRQGRRGTWGNGSIVVAYARGRRVSSDKFGKQRRVHSLDSVIRGESEPDILMNKDLQAYNIISKDLCAGRTRTVLGMNNVVNSLIGVFYAAAESYYLSHFSFTFKHRGPSDIKQKVDAMLSRKLYGTIENERDALIKRTMSAIDFSNFDNSIPPFLMAAFQEHVTRLLGDTDFAYLINMMDTAPVFQPDDGSGDGWAISYDPFTNRENIVNNEEYLAGIRSGERGVSSKGKFFGTFIVLDALFSLLKIKKEFIRLGIIEGLLSGHFIDKQIVLEREDGSECLLAFGLLNQGDDNLFFLDSANVTATDLIAEINARYLDAQEEDGLNFLHNFIIREKNEKEVRVIPSLESFLVNTFIPERDYRSQFRKFWWIGIRDRDLIYADNPYYLPLLSAINPVFEKHYPSLGTFSEFLAHAYRLGEKQRDDLFDTAALSWADLEFLRNPESIHYKVDPADVSAHLLASSYDYISTEDFIRLVDTLLLKKGSFQFDVKEA